MSIERKGDLLARGDRERARIVDFWRAVELSEPQKVERPDLRSDTPVSEVRARVPPPWGATCSTVGWRADQPRPP
ncbi:hypothetical protein H4W79_002097 [Nocardiopsis terrae]|uniref:Uncharacterized protein n=1 Tax=Nocardiopsis terrae TaxID=372655 RepID=A0ABR9HFS3_9ACTN|nr:hypothetical protein [Nocardiopsis terrae]MBE1457883.1 hypothetical protein [Nocardiopsis terrae]